MKIQVMIKSVYGKELVYPACETAKRFARLIKKLTLDKTDLAIIQELGYTIETVSAYKL